MADGLTTLQAQLLWMLATTGDRFGISDARTAKALERKGLAKWHPKSRAVSITARGRRLTRLADKLGPWASK